MILSKENLNKIKEDAGIILPKPGVFNLPEKVLQFGTGVLLRGLPDYFIDKANREGIFNGRVVVVKSTDKGDTTEFDDQDGLYTLCIRGIEDGQKIEENIVSAAISRVLTAGNDWPEILAFAASPDLEVVISNTTEVGIQLVKDSVEAQPPVSFPGKLLAVLVARYQAFNGDRTKGLVIVPAELVPDNGTKLRNIVVELARQNNLNGEFMTWLNQHNTFCNSLVDRIVPGKPDAETLATLEGQLGYQDRLLSMSEVYRLWAIEGDQQVKEVLSFAQADTGVIVAPDIDIYRELKLRLLNGTHTLSCGVAFLAGIGTVKEAMDDEAVSAFIATLMQEEIAPAIPYPVPAEEAAAFSRKVLDRFRNPHIEHQWLSITMNYTAKLYMRIIPVLLRYYKSFEQVPECMAFGFAIHIHFMKSATPDNGSYYGSFNGNKYLIQDEQAAYFYNLWQGQNEDDILIEEVLKNHEFWGQDLTTLPDFSAAVKKHFHQIKNNGILAAINTLELNRVSV